MTSLVPVQTGADLRTALEAAVVSNYRLLFTIAYGIVRNSHAAEDVVQSAALKAYSQIDRIKSAESIVSWLAAITRNHALDTLRKGGSTKMVGIDGRLLTGDCPAAPTAPEKGAEDYQALRDAVATLPEGEATVVTLRYLEDLSIEEVARRLGIRAGAARVRLHRGVRKLFGNPRLRKAYAALT
jgi:RNA polymerase sigma-70 factor (ECF subfamily)